MSSALGEHVTTNNSTLTKTPHHIPAPLRSRLKGPLAAASVAAQDITEIHPNTICATLNLKKC